jgi:predicted RNA-binding Zn-ribbon protein involved in translation (DUF1610 family)
MADENHPQFCSDCGMSLVKLETACTSRQCNDCGKEIFYIRRAENGGIKVEKGESFHIPSITLSLDPKSNSRFFRPGFEPFLKQLFLEKNLNPEDIVVRFKELESNIDTELIGLDCIKHCDLETKKGTEEAAETLEKEGLMTYWYNLARSSNLRRCYEAIEKGDTLTAVYSCHIANIFKEYSLLEDDHLKEILWLGYNCYFDLEKNKNTSIDSIKEVVLIRSLLPKIKSLDEELIYSFINDGLDIGSRIGVSGIAEETLKSLLEHELEKRKKIGEDTFKERDIRTKESSNKIKIWMVLFTLVNALILTFYKNWLS